MRHTIRRAELGPFLALSLAAVCGLIASPCALAGPAEYVSTPIVEEGEREIDFKTGVARSRNGSQESQTSIGLGWGVSSHWFTEVYALWHKEPSEKLSFDAWEWENKWQLTEQGEYAWDLGWLLEIERPRDRSEGYEVRWGPLLQRDFTPKWQGNVNLLIEQHLRAAEASEPSLGYQWQLKYRAQAEFEFGAQGLGSVGPWRAWAPASAQSHVAGPAVFGRFKTGSGPAVRYNAAWLIGMSNGAPRNTGRLQVELEF
jgi:hypothetical protein